MSNLHNILDYMTFINEERPSRITINGKTNTITIDKVRYKNAATKEIFNEVDDITRTPFIKDLTGGYKREFDDEIRANIDTIERVRNTATYPEPADAKDRKNLDDDGRIYYFKFPDIDPNKDNKVEDKCFTKETLNKIFMLKPRHGDIGSGEVLMAAYYTNVKRNKLKSQGGESGDCTAEIKVNDSTEPKRVCLEIKAADSKFFKIKKYIEDFNIVIDEELLDKGVKDNDLYPYVAGIAYYISKEKKNDELHFILFDNEIRVNNTMKGYLTFVRTPGEGIESITNRLIKITEFSEKGDTKGGKKSRDFTISFKDGKIQIHRR